MPYKDRECYLGVTDKLGYLDKGGHWRRRDWWTKLDLDNDEIQRREEIKRVKAEEERLMNEKLGLVAPKEKDLGDSIGTLTNYEMQEMLRRTTGQEFEMMEEREKAERINGLGFEKRRGAQGVGKEFTESELNRLDGVGVEEIEKMKKRILK